jgi:hypothetical protein
MIEAFEFWRNLRVGAAAFVRRDTDFSAATLWLPLFPRCLVFWH